jgi:hypothetical protein
MKRFIMPALWLFVAALTLSRPLLPVQLDLTWFAVYKDLVHVFIGALIGAAICTRCSDLWWMAAIPSAVELVVALVK